MKNNPLALLGFILMTAPLGVIAQQSGDFTYTSDGSAITITGYTGPGGAVTIPATITDLPVTVIGNFAFSNKTSLTSVAIPNSVISIGNGGFTYCHRLASITIPDSVGSIGYGAFYDCTSLTSVTIPNSVASIGDTAFEFCTSLTAITVDAANSFYTSVEGVLFDKNQTTLVEFPGGKGGSYTIPNGVTSIGYGAFYKCTSLTSVTMFDGATNIGYGAFSFCISLKGVFFKGNAPSVESDVFYGTDNATVYYLPGTTGWGATFAGRPTALWNPLMQAGSVGPAGFGFNITGTADIPIVVEAATKLANASWVPLQSLNLTNGAFHFSDPNWTNYPARFYRIRSP